MLSLLDSLILLYFLKCNRFSCFFLMQIKANCKYNNWTRWSIVNSDTILCWFVTFSGNISPHTNKYFHDHIYNRWLFFDICIILKDKRFFSMSSINQISDIFWSSFFFPTSYILGFRNTFPLLCILFCSLP